MTSVPRRCSVYVVRDANTVGTDDELQRIDAVTDTALARLDLDELLDELLTRVRELLGADTAAVLLRDAEGDRLTARAAAGLEEEVLQGVRVPLGKGFAGRIAAERRPVVLDRIDRSTVMNRLLWEKGIRSLLGVPLLAAGELVGVLHVGSLRERRFTDENVHLLQLVGDRIALAVQARLSGIQRAAASALQRSLLPARLPEVPGVEFATRYVPGSGTGVGGDWYDVFPLTGGRWGVVIGDVVGHGLPAATVMGRLRSVLRAYATEHEEPADVLAKLNDYVRRFEPHIMATVVYAVLDSASESLRLSTAGHLAPILACPDRTAVTLDIPIDPPIGVPSMHRRRTHRCPLPPESLLFFYTDGLVERRDRVIDEGLQRLCATLTTGPAEDVCAWVMARLIGLDPPADDIAILAISRRNVAETNNWCAQPTDR